MTYYSDNIIINEFQRYALDVKASGVKAEAIAAESHTPGR